MNTLVKGSTVDNLLDKFVSLLKFLDKDYVVIDRLSFIPMEARRKHGEVKWFVDRPGVFCYAAWNDDYTDPTQGRLKVNLRVLEDAYWQHFAMAKDKAKQIILDKQAEDYIAHTVFGEER